MKHLKGLHHVTAITSSAERIYQFFTYVLGLRLVKKTINQDDIQTYHLFFADDAGSPRTDVTFFDFPGMTPAVKGSDEISRIGLRVPTDASLAYWAKRFKEKGVDHLETTSIFGRKTLFFSDFDHQDYALFSDEGIKGVAPGRPWKKGPIPNEFAIYGLGPIFFRVSDVAAMNKALVVVLSMRMTSQENNMTLYEMGVGGNGASIIVEKDADAPTAIQGYGGVHHIAFRIEDKAELDEWLEHYRRRRIPNSGYVDRFYFKSLYARIYRPILFELATDGPGFIDDEESYVILGETLALPPRFRAMRDKITKMVRHIDTVRSDLDFKKEY